PHPGPAVRTGRADLAPPGSVCRGPSVPCRGGTPTIAYPRLGTQGPLHTWRGVATWSARGDPRPAADRGGSQSWAMRRPDAPANPDRGACGPPETGGYGGVSAASRRPPPFD